MSIEGLAASYFTDWSVPTYKDLAFKGIKALSFFTVICPIVIGATWLTSSLLNRVSRYLFGHQEETSKKVAYVAAEKLPTSYNSADKGQMSTATTAPVASQTEKKELILPAFLADLVQAKKIPIIEKEIEYVADIRKLNLTQAATILAGEKGKGIALKLKINHVSLKDKEIGPSEPDEELQKSLIRRNSTEGFTVFGYATLEENKGRFHLAEVNLKHRGGIVNSRSIFNGNSFHFAGVTKEQIARFAAIECQDQLATDKSLKTHSHDLAWALTRLLNGQSIKIREFLAGEFVCYFDRPPFGYWEITLAE